jgi:predicted dehydrogenase
MKEPIRVALIGYGWAGKRHAHVYNQGGVEIYWKIHVEREQVEMLAGTHRAIRVSTNYQ